MNVSDCARSAPNTATARAPPTRRLVLKTALAVPAKRLGTLLSNTAVTGGDTNGPAKPTSLIIADNCHTGVEGGNTAMVASPIVLEARPATMSVRDPTRRARLTRSNGTR
jgi:hypothetical protein